MSQPNIEELKEHVGRLATLLSTAETGLSTWWMFYLQRMEKIVPFIPSEVLQAELDRRRAEKSDRGSGPGGTP